MSKERYRRPDGRYTTDVKLYAREWRKLAREVEAVLQLGFKLSGFDPGILLVRDYGRALDLTADVALAIQKYYKQTTKEKKS